MNVLAVDGGGVRGVIPAILLQELEQRLGGALHQHFDLIAGTSTGGLIALGLSYPLRDGRPLTAGELLEVYRDNGNVIFPQHWWNGVRNLFAPKYSGAGLTRVLARLFQQARLAEALTPVLIACYDLARQVPYFFKSESAKVQPQQNWPLVSVALATSAAPTYLPAFATRGPDGQRYVFADGGLYANNPAVAAYAEAARRSPQASVIHLVSIGTGNARDDLRARDAIHWGLLGWARQIAPVMMDGVSEADDYEATWLCERGQDRFWRLQPELKPEESAMDNPAAIPALCATAREYAQQQVAVLDEIAAALLGRDAASSAAPE